ncbi:hypothetical protein YC2023_087280 [Brassica napus]|uniref:(rape) hypothetical protein n=1 Tax=Brassica napus TaxID=3708 RepID=A0A816NCF1_BRANA|nr:unnamed protein product [Brassica napus]
MVEDWRNGFREATNLKPMFVTIYATFLVLLWISKSRSAKSYFKIQLCKRCVRVACGWGCVDRWCVDSWSMDGLRMDG